MNYIQVIFGSVLLMIRLIFSTCRYITKIVKLVTKIKSKRSCKKKEIIVATTPVSIEAKETYLNRYNVPIKVMIIAKNNRGFIPKIIPPEVATAFPPLNLAKIG